MQQEWRKTLGSFVEFKVKTFPEELYLVVLCLEIICFDQPGRATTEELPSQQTLQQLMKPFSVFNAHHIKMIKNGVRKNDWTLRQYVNVM